jgi:hypothetical protein
MKVVIILEDTTKGIYPEVRWKGNGVCDHPPDSISLHLCTLLVKQIEELAKAGALVVVKEPMSPEAEASQRRLG